MIRQIGLSTDRDSDFRILGNTNEFVSLCATPTLLEVRSAVSGQRSAVSYFIQQLFGLVWLFAFSCSV
ncbi:MULTISPECIES: hypothetical protein [Moorena]|uniref:Uncharacterized protein n=1 Tax=Moorena producens (strain JHB) TaxID=1454205 RepID=A0A9Q9UVR7_MOOP1|nr:MULTISPECIES: hypothetical protein [Moorena]NER89862.1 hypothetical protein [Moorena sp. SIO3A2]NET63389.1 hypothetical protein [Moorena sp. SIO1G6]WAN69109.1 hypothetical protein BJP36_42875 [Moorena producens JHB]